MENQPKYITRCRLRREDGSECPHIITAYGVPTQDVGTRSGKEISEFVAALLTHLKKKHPEARATIDQTVEQFFGFMILGMFELSDPSIQKSVTMFSAHLRKLWSMPSISDAQLEEATAKKGFTQDDPHRTAALDILKHLRAHYEGTLTLQPVPPAQEQPKVSKAG